MYLRAKKENIKQKRLESNFTKHGLSIKSGLGPLAVHRMEEENHLIHPLRAKAVSDILGCDIKELFEEV